MLTSRLPLPQLRRPHQGRQRPITGALAVTAVLAISASGCGALGLGDDDSAAAADGADSVIAAFYPLQYAAQRVVGDQFEVTNLTAAGGEPHDLELTAAQTGEIADTDLIVYLEDFQPTVDDAIEQSGGDRGLNVGDSVDLLTFDEEHTDDEHEHSDEEHTDDEHEHSDEEHTDDEHEHSDEDGHDHGDVDPHFWLDPLRLADAADAIADRLADLDADHADTYAANAADLRADLEALDTEYTDGLANCAVTTVVVNHDAFGYLDRYGLDFHSIVGLSPDAEPTAADLAELESLVTDTGVTTIFAERLASSADAEALATTTGLEVAVLDPIEGLTDQTADDDYLSLMEANLTALTEANGC